MWLYPDPGQALDLAVRLCAVAQLIGLVELFLARRELVGGGFLDWSMIGNLDPHTRTRAGSLLRRLFRRVSVPALAGLGVLDAEVVTALLVWPSSVSLIGAAIVMQVIFIKRHHLTVDGSDQMTFVVLCACLVGRLGGSGGSLRAAVWFLAAELALSYVVAGVYKATSPYWQSGAAFSVLVQTRMYGQPMAARAVRRHPAAGRLADHIVLSWESLFFVALVAPLPVTAALLAVGLGFHAGCGIIMGLNRFVWAFVACYPALLWANASVRSTLGPHLADVTTVIAAGLGGLALLAAQRLSPAVTTNPAGRSAVDRPKTGWPGARARL